MSKRSPTPANTNISTHQDAGTAKVVVTGSSHATQVDADKAIWDTVSNVYVLPENTNFNSNK